MNALEVEPLIRQPNAPLNRQPAQPIVQAVKDLAAGTLSTMAVSVTSISTGWISIPITYVLQPILLAGSGVPDSKIMPKNAREKISHGLGGVCAAVTGAFASYHVDREFPQSQNVAHTARIGATVAVIATSAGCAVPTIAASVSAAAVADRILPETIFGIPKKVLSGTVLGGTAYVAFFMAPIPTATALLGGAALGASVGIARRFFNW